MTPFAVVFFALFIFGSAWGIFMLWVDATKPKPPKRDYWDPMQ